MRDNTNKRLDVCARVIVPVRLSRNAFLVEGRLRDDLNVHCGGVTLLSKAASFARVLMHCMARS